MKGDIGMKGEKGKTVCCYLRRKQTHAAPHCMTDDRSRQFVTHVQQ
jgi:hypothetical protein